MALAHCRRVAFMLVLALPLTIGAPAKTTLHAIGDGLGTDSKVTIVVAVLGVVVVGIGVGVYFAIHHAHSASGCVESDSAGLTLIKDGDRQSYRLLGATGGIKPGERIRVHGAKKKSVAAITDQQSFVIEKLDRDYGPCKLVSP